MTSREPDRSLLWPAILVGVGVAGSLDEIVLHQLLRWHHFYDRGSAAAGVDRRRHLPSRLDCRAGRWTGVVGAPLAGGARAAATGGGGCPARGGRLQLYDGIVQHKLLGLHQVRAGAPNNFPYDLGFIGLAVVVLLAGLLMLRTTRSAGRPAPSRSGS